VLFNDVTRTGAELLARQTFACGEFEGRATSG
jgi:hypothetical protein